MTEKDLYQKMEDAGVVSGNHASDLYVFDTHAAREILNQYPLEKANSSRFRCNVTERRGIEIPFAYSPHFGKAFAAL